MSVAPLLNIHSDPNNTSGCGYLNGGCGGYGGGGVGYGVGKCEGWWKCGGGDCGYCNGDGGHGGGVVEVVVAVDTAMEAVVVMEKEVVDTEVEDVRDRYSGGGSSYS
ncbi:unnamed protein product [Brassica napus]|uniref:(rape) hypothetical protein n=1 Tax=Brassica napus TaxID=3708 RepID=A0A816K0K3_BRANA|nr:unnamed protein product [Brassica napus]